MVVVCVVVAWRRILAHNLDQEGAADIRNKEGGGERDFDLPGIENDSEFHRLWWWLSWYGRLWEKRAFRFRDGRESHATRSRCFCRSSKACRDDEEEAT